MLDTEFIHKALGLSAPEKNESYNFFRLSSRAGTNDVAFLFNYKEKSSIEELADFAIERGATLLVSEQQIGDYPCLIVDDLLEAWIKLSSAYRKCYDVRVVGVTGSIGKTTTKEFIVAALGNFVKSNAGNLNLRWNVGKIVQGLKEEHKFYVQEISEFSMDNAAVVSKMIHPEIGVITKIGESHLEKFGTIENIINSCFGITAGMADNGIIVVNADDAYQMSYDIDFKRITYGIQNAEAHYRAINIKPIYNVENFGIDFEVAYENRVVPLHIKFLGEHNIYCALAAFAVAKILKLTDAEIQENLLNVKPRTKGIRQNLLNIGSYSLYLDCFNANEDSMKAALNTLQLLKNESEKPQRIAILGDILEVGEKAAQIHTSVGEFVAESNIDVLITCGDLAKIIANVAKTNPNIKVFSTANIIEASRVLQEVLKQDAIILFKAGNSTNLDLIADRVFGTNLYESSQRLFNKEVVTVDNYDVAIYPKAGYTKIVNYFGKKKTIHLPEKINDLPAWSIGKNSFANNEDIEEVEIPEGVVRIQTRAFYKNISLNRVKSSADLKHIGVSSFEGCKNLRNLSMPDSVITIDSRAFAYCRRLKNVKLPANLQLLGSKVFFGCSNLQQIIVPNHLRRIPVKAFAGCEKLREIIIPSNIVFIADDAFESCSQLGIVTEKDSYAWSYAQQHEIRVLTPSQFKWISFSRKVKRRLKAIVKREK